MIFFLVYFYGVNRLFEQKQFQGGQKKIFTPPPWLKFWIRACTLANGNYTRLRHNTWNLIIFEMTTSCARRKLINGVSGNYLQSYQQRMRLQRRLTEFKLSISLNPWFPANINFWLFFSKSSNKPFKTHIKARRPNLNLESSYLKSLCSIHRE